MGTISSASNSKAISAHNIKVAVAMHPVAGCAGCQIKVPTLYLTGDADTVVSPSSVKQQYQYARGMEKVFAEVKGASHVDATGFGPNNEDVYAYDWLNCKLKGDQSACTRVTTCTQPGLSAVKCHHSPSLEEGGKLVKQFMDVSGL